jgi:VanZ family protein
MAQSHRLLFRIALMITLLAITYLAFTRPDHPVVPNISDKLNHLLAFYVLAFLLDFSFPSSELGAGKFFVLLVYGLFIEVVQFFLPDRTASLLDLLADAAGIGLYRLSIPALKYAPFVGQRWSEPS